MEVPGRVLYVKLRLGYLNDTPHALEEQSEGIVWDIRKSENMIFECLTQFLPFISGFSNVSQNSPTLQLGPKQGRVT